MLIGMGYWDLMINGAILLAKQKNSERKGIHLLKMIVSGEEQSSRS